MSRNAQIKRMARAVRWGKLQRALRRMLIPTVEVQQGLFGKFEFSVDLSMGALQKHLFWAPEVYELETQDVLRKLLRPGMTVLDIGANVGFFSVLMGDLVGERGRVCSFEPYPPNFALLKSNIDRNRLHWVEAFPIALSDREGEATLTINPVNDGGHSLGDLSGNPDVAGDAGGRQVTVRTETVDEFVRRAEIESVDLIKIDVEGAETLVLAGASRTLSAEPGPIVICEVGDQAQAQFGKTEAELRSILYSAGYRSYFIHDGLVEFGPETPVEGLPNVLFAKGDLRARMGGSAE